MKAELMEIGIKAKEAAGKMALLETNKKNEVLNCVAKNLIKDAKTLIAENAKDMEAGKANGMPEGLLDRLLLTEKRIEQMAEGLEQVAALDDPIGEVLSMKKRPNGLRIGQKRVPLGVVGIIYEARPNVTADAFGLCFKTGNAVILKGGSDALHSNIAIVASIRRTLAECGVDENAIALIEDTSRDHDRIYENERICRCFDPTRWSRTDPCRCRKCNRTGNRDRNRQLPYLCR